MDGLAEVAELLVSELVTNAVRASVISDQPVVRLLLMSEAGGLRISVWDSASGGPQRRQLPADDAGGRGLLLVETLSADYGCYQSAGAGKVVWCVVQPGEVAPARSISGPPCSVRWPLRALIAQYARPEPHDPHR